MLYIKIRIIIQINDYFPNYINSPFYLTLYFLYLRFLDKFEKEKLSFNISSLFFFTWEILYIKSI